MSQRKTRPGAYWFLRVLLGWMMAWSHQAFAFTCTDIFTDGMQAHGAAGNINFGGQSRIAGGITRIPAKTVTNNSGIQSCSGAYCVASGVPSTTSTPTFQTRSTDKGSINVAYQGTYDASSGNYDSVYINEQGSLRFTTDNGAYYTKAWTSGYRSEIRLRSGDYWIDGNVLLAEKTVLRRVSASGTTRIFVKGNVTLGYEVTTDAFTSNQLLIYATGTISTHQLVNIHGFLYAAGNLTLDHRATVHGAVAGSSVSANNGQVVVNYQGNLLASANFAPFCSGVSYPQVLLANWQMDEGSWNGTASEVKDSSGNASHGRARIAAGTTSVPSTASGSPAFTASNQNTCYYGVFDKTTAPVQTYTYVELGNFPVLSNSFSAGAWIRSTNASAQNQPIFVRDDANNGWGLNLAAGSGSPKLRFYARNLTNNGAVSGQGSNPSCGSFCIDTNAVLTSNAWYYVAASVDTVNKTVTLYVYNQAGSLQAKASGAYSGTWSDGSGMAAIGGETIASSEGTQTAWHFLGNIDEATVYSGVLSQASIEALMQAVRICPGPDHYELQVASESIACEGATVTVRACTNNQVPCTVDTTVGSNVTLSTNAGSLNATTLTLSSGVASTKLLHPAAANGAVATVTLSNEQALAINPRKCCTGPSNCAVANSCDTEFKTAGFIFSNSATTTGNIPTQLAGTTDSNVYLRAVKTNTSTGACTARFAAPQTVQLAYKCVNPVTCIAGQTLSLGGTNIQSNANSVVPASISYTDKSLTFDVNGSAAIPFNYSDVGQVNLIARLALAATATEPAYTLTGTSNDFVVKPHSIVVSGVTTAANAANPGTTSGGAGFAAAGEAFKVFVQARNSAAAPTPNFGNELVPETSALTLVANTLVYPGGGTLTAPTSPSDPTLIPALVNTGSFSATTPAGTFVNSDYRFNQAGSITLLPVFDDNNAATANDGDYLGGGDIPNLIQSGTVGRFYPNHYRLASSSTANSCGGFSYMDQPTIPVDYTLHAESLSGVALGNYDNHDQSTLYSNTASVAFVAENANAGDGSSLSPRAIITGTPALTWNDGVLSLNTVSNPSLLAEFVRVSPSATPDGPYASLQLGLKVTDTLDARGLKDMNMNAATTGTCSGAGCDAITLGSVLNLRYGRLRLDDAFGPETVELPVNFVTEYWTGSYFAKNTADSCTALLRSAIAYPDGNIANAANLVVSLSGGSTTGLYGAAANTATEVRFEMGDAKHKFQAPSGNATGSFAVNVNLSTYDWLRFDWDQDGDYTDDTSLPTARFGFGSYRGHDRIIYWREKFQ